MTPPFSPGATIDEVYTIEFKTTVTDPDDYAANRSNITYRNTASIDGDNIPVSSNEGTQRLDSEVIDKSNQGYNYETKVIDWRIQVNQNEMTLGDAPNPIVISDTINAGRIREWFICHYKWLRKTGRCVRRRCTLLYKLRRFHGLR
ncbi:MAG: hypothetical protein KAQ68_01140 [Clostridiales bacterium]|nr:hypothetical protein [Clostridiales bacterium]